MKNKHIIILVIAIILLSIISLATKYQGHIDTGDYLSPAKYFADNYAAKLRLSHSMLYGFVLSPFIKITNNTIPFKIASILFLSLIIASIYYITKSKKAMLMMLFSPIIWYMGPWINPIQLSSLLFLWAYYFIKKNEKEENIKWVLLSGILSGLSFAFWDGAIIFLIILGIVFLLNKKVYILVTFIIGILIGLLPKLILDQIYMGFAFSGIIRYIMGLGTATFFQGVYGQMISGPMNIITKIIILLFIPLFIYKIFSKNFIKENKKEFIFILLSLFILLKQAQLRYLLIFIPILIIELHSLISKKEFKLQIIYSLIIILLVITPYIIQINNTTNIVDFHTLITNINNIQINKPENIEENLNNIYSEYPSKIFLVGNKPDDYQVLAEAYWGKNIKELVSIEDYSLYKQNKTTLFEKKLMPNVNKDDRRQIWIVGGIDKNHNDKTDYNSIKYAIGLNEPIKLKEFKFVKQYGNLYLLERITN